MAEYTPTTSDIRSAYIIGRWMNMDPADPDKWRPRVYRERFGAEFDRWMERLMGEVTGVTR